MYHEQIVGPENKETGLRNSHTMFVSVIESVQEEPILIGL